MDNPNRDRAMMLDPSTARARVFVKNLPLNNVSRAEVEDHFSKYGKISGLLLQKHFSFIQFEEVQPALDAIENENGQVFHGKILEVAHARMPLDKASLAAQRAARGGGNGRGGRDRSPLRDDEVDWRDDPYDYDYRGGGRSVRPGPYREDDYYASEVRTMAPPIDERTNDCEIMVHNKKQRAYAEMIERKLKGLGMTVDLLFPNESIPVTRVLANISSRGTLYAITVSPQNEELHSLTLNILHGIPEEHRNMPLEQALVLVNRNFEAFVSAGGQRTGAKVVTPMVSVSGPAVITPHPETIQVMLNLLAQNRSLTVLQYDTLLRYLTQRREQQVKLELGDTSIAPPPLPPVEDMNPHEDPMVKEQLKNRILNIMKSRPMAGPQPPLPTSTMTSTSNTWGATSSNSSAPILHDPQVQRALDKLFQGGSILDKIGSRN